MVGRKIKESCYLREFIGMTLGTPVSLVQQQQGEQAKAEVGVVEMQ